MNVVNVSVQTGATHTSPRKDQSIIEDISYLTSREREILTFAARGQTRKQISEHLCISEETIKNHIHISCQKLNAINKTQAVAAAMTLGWIAPYRKK